MKSRLMLSLLFALFSSFSLACGSGSGGDETVSEDTEPPIAEVSAFKPTPGTSWQIQLSGKVDTSVSADIFIVDLIDTPQEQIDLLKSGGKKIICYFSAGSWESFRADAGRYPETVKGKPLDDFPDEKWLDIRSLDILMPIIESRIDLAAAKGCDGVDPDNMDGYSNDSGFSLTGADQLKFNRAVASAAHRKNLAVGLKNDLEQVAELVGDFDWAVNEQCFEFEECQLLSPFIAAGKPVFGIEYSGDFEAICKQANSLNFDTLIKDISLDSTRRSCR
jgi:hypothetical protein